ncbi:MAG: S41 family peptidase [Gudongella sp.]|nr:S41 family peptidase [Gudongella sp.]
MKKQLLLILIIISLLVPTAAFAVEQHDISSHPETDIYLFLQVYQYIKEAYPLEIEDKTLVEAALRGMLESVDSYSEYYTAAEAEALYSDVYGSFVGIGVYIDKQGDYIHVIETIEGGNAKKEGILADDLIVSIDGTNAKDISTTEASTLIKGEKGTVVRLGIKRAGKEEIIYFDIERAEVKVSPVTYEVIDNRIGYIKLTEFNQQATSEVMNALSFFDTKMIEKVILDIRNNPGGLLDQAIKLSRLFVPRGPIVHLREPGKELYTYNSITLKPRYELVLLVNEKSASASEILTGAVKDAHSGIVIGKKTFGKGIVQSLIPLMEGGIVKLTTAEYLTPNKTRIHGIGIQPDIEIENEPDNDLQLQKAIEVLRGK